MAANICPRTFSNDIKKEIALKTMDINEFHNKLGHINIEMA